MTQEWFESADFEKTANNEKKEHPSDLVIPQEELKEKEELPVVEENLQVIPEEQEADLEKVESDEHEEIVENTEKIDKSEEPVETEEQEELATKTDQAEEPVKEASQPSKSLESPFVPDPVPTKTAIFKEELADFWVWLQGALKEPTASIDTDKKHSYNAFALLTIFSATSFLFTVYHAKQAYYGHMAAIDSKALQHFPSLNLFSIFSILVATSLFFFSILMGGFVVKRFVDQDRNWTLEKALQEYSRLFALPILLTGIASFFAFFNSLRFAVLLCLISIGLVLLANLYTISKPSKESQTDFFYRLLLAFLVNGSILFLFFLAEMALVFDYLRILAFI
ncbi:DUF6574 domain-containing protein [Streptococcus infantis]|uniref:DUF6574 domain-containing protein n=1 Tax=Streptococcus infantis TaxID=68892 RepID=UPI001CC08871|nr:DUF6574 domain-containing protein [Streptococcus infantis]MBZ2120527.1 hypothetical protein [Streptococcus infantis]MBZ2122346.1 hypothetical protein [Streptococcus infantis]MBZ2126148.1 hypothetical protein [Streptococcus infantis]